MSDVPGWAERYRVFQIYFSRNAASLVKSILEQAVKRMANDPRHYDDIRVLTEVINQLKVE